MMRATQKPEINQVSNTQINKKRKRNDDNTSHQNKEKKQKSSLNGEQYFELIETHLCTKRKDVDGFIKLVKEMKDNDILYEKHKYGFKLYNGTTIWHLTMKYGKLNHIIALHKLLG